MTTTWSTTDQTAGVTLSNGNLTATFSATAGRYGVRSIDRVYSGKYYWEITYTTASNLGCGVMLAATPLGGWGAAGDPATNLATIVSSTGTINVNLNSTGIALGNIANGTVVCFAV